MRHICSGLVLITLLSTARVLPAAAQSADSTWTLSDALELAAAYNDPARWDLETLDADTEQYAEMDRDIYPLNATAHPIPAIGTPGLGIGALPPQFGLTIADRPIASAFASFSGGRYTADARSEAGAAPDASVTLFSIFVLAEDAEYTPVQAVSSRSRPHMVWQGTVDRTATTAVDWVAFHTADGNSYAVVNGRLFDLHAGRAIWVVPMEDGSVRYHQDVDVSFMTEPELLQYIQGLSGREDAVAFFGQEGSVAPATP